MGLSIILLSNPGQYTRVQARGKALWDSVLNGGASKRRKLGAIGGRRLMGLDGRQDVSAYTGWDMRSPMGKVCPMLEIKHRGAVAEKPENGTPTSCMLDAKSP